jgi:hypothetical protein
MLRKLQIAFSVTCGILCLLLIALWVRSIRTVDYLYPIYDPIEVVLWSSEGKVRFEVWNVGKAQFRNADFRDYFFSGRFTVLERSKSRYRSAGRYPMPTDTVLGFRWYSWRAFYVPYWFPIMLFAVLATVPWLPWQFSLRTLLIAMTLVAMMLGLIVAARL